MFSNFCGIKIQGKCFQSEVNLKFFSEEYHRFCLVYGKNGSGKSTISQAFDAIKQNNQSLIIGQIIDKSGALAFINEEEKNNIFVFNEEYVNSKIKIEDDGLHAIVLLGGAADIGEKLQKRENIRENPVNILVYPGRNQRLFSNEEEYNHLVSLAEEQWEEKKGDVRYSLKTADDGETRYLEKITLEAIVRNQKARKEYIRNNPESMLESIQEGKDLFLEEEFESILSLIEEREKERKAIRKNPELILEKIEENRKLFLSEEEFNHLVELGKERKKQKEQEKEENK